MFEKEAEEYVCGLFPSVNVFASGRLIQAFKDGAKFGYNKVNEWHDLRKNPDDLPKRDERFDTKVSVPVFSSKGNFVVYYFETKEWYCNGQKEEVIAWCEVPRFKEIKG